MKKQLAFLLALILMLSLGAGQAFAAGLGSTPTLVGLEGADGTEIEDGEITRIGGEEGERLANEAITFGAELIESMEGEEIDDFEVPLAGFTAERKTAPKSEGVMTYAEFAEAELDTEVVIEAYVQGAQDWWDNKATVYTSDEDGAYFLYNMACSEEDYAKLVPGTRIRVTGYKAEWSGEVEIVDATFEILDGEPWLAEARDLTALLGSEDLIEFQNQLVAFKGLTVEAYDETGAAFAYKNAENKTDDLYFKVSLDGDVFDFCVEYYLCNEETDVYKAVENLQVGDVIDLEGFLYWYNGPNPHVISVTPAA